MKRIGIKIFTALNWLMGCVFFITASAVNDASWFQIKVCAISGLYLGCALYISNKIKEKKGQCKNEY